MKVYGDLKRQMEDLTTGLGSLGIDAELSESRQSEQDIGSGGIFKKNRSLGLINIAKGLIRWINLREASEGQGPDGLHVLYSYYMDYGVRNDTGARLPNTTIVSVRKKRFLIFGAVVATHWRGSFALGRDIANRLNAEPSMILPMIWDDDFEITSYPEHESWILSAKEWKVPSRLQWDAYQALAETLLSATQSHRDTERQPF